MPEIMGVKWDKAALGKNIFEGSPLHSRCGPPFMVRTPPGVYIEANPPDGHMNWLKMIFVWWRGATFGTLLTTWWSGQFVGGDQFGNRYYQNRNGTRRWLIYNGLVEASRVPPDWHGWLHFTFREPPTVAPFKMKPWEKAYSPNMTGTDLAYRPAGSLAATGKHAPATDNYEPWVPE